MRLPHPRGDGLPAQTHPKRLKQVLGPAPKGRIVSAAEKQIFPQSLCHTIQQECEALV